MCGIYGQFNKIGADAALVIKMAECLQHRGPDGYGIYHHGPLAFGAGRLAIIDLEAGTQPIFNEQHTIAVVFNGEIYNYQSLRLALEKLGHIFATKTDTEVIVHGFESWGIAVLQRLRGMFALGIWDEAAEQLWLARDRLGEKPLYFVPDANNFLFASEIKALFELPSLPRRVNEEALPYFLTLGYTPPPMTMFAGIEKLAPGEYLQIDRAGICRKRYWYPSLDTVSDDKRLSYAQAVKQVRRTLTEAVEMRLMSDVPLGALLSGGVDSTAVVALMGRAMGRPVETFTVGFDFLPKSKNGRKFNVDMSYAALAARQLGSHHHEITINAAQLTDQGHLAELLPYLIYAMDEPIAQPAIIQTVYVAALARQKGIPVLLGGDGSDELFAGYNAYRADRILERYLHIPELLRNSALTPALSHLPKSFGSLRKLAEKSRHTDLLRRYLAWMKIVDIDQLPALLEDGNLVAGAENAMNQRLLPVLQTPKTKNFADRIAFTSLHLWIAEDSNMRLDKMNMAMSVEARSPFQDHELVDLAYTLPLSYKLRRGDFKVVLKDAIADLVPTEILEREKWGFRPPLSEWLRTILRPLVDTYLAPDRIASAYFQREAVQRIVNAHLIKGQYELWSLWPLLVFHLWHAIYIEQSLTLDHKLGLSDVIGK